MITCFSQSRWVTRVLAAPRLPLVPPGALPAPGPPICARYGRRSIRQTSPSAWYRTCCTVTARSFCPAAARTAMSPPSRRTSSVRWWALQVNTSLIIVNCIHMPLMIWILGNMDKQWGSFLKLASRGFPFSLTRTRTFQNSIFWTGKETPSVYNPQQIFCEIITSQKIA